MPLLAESNPGPLADVEFGDRASYVGERAFRQDSSIAGGGDGDIERSPDQSPIKIKVDVARWKACAEGGEENAISKAVLRNVIADCAVDLVVTLTPGHLDVKLGELWALNSNGVDLERVAKMANSLIPEHIQNINVAVSGHTIHVNPGYFDESQFEEHIKTRLLGLEKVLQAIKILHPDAVIPAEISIPKPPLQKQSEKSALSFSPFKVDISVDDFLVAPSVSSFQELVLPPQLTRELRGLAASMKDPSVIERYGVDQVTGILLHGPAGTGKTSIIHALASESGWPSYAIKASDIFKPLVGQSEQTVAQFFKRLRPNCILFIDEVEQIAADPRGMHEVQTKIIAALKSHLGGPGARKDILIAAATNRPESLDDTLFRAERFSMKLEVPLPDMEGRKAIFKLNLDKAQSRAKQKDLYGDALFNDQNLEQFARISEGFSGADISDAIKTAVRGVAAHAQESGTMERITTEHVRAAIEEQARKRGVVAVERSRPISGFGGGGR